MKNSSQWCVVVTKKWLTVSSDLSDAPLRSFSGPSRVRAFGSYPGNMPYEYFSDEIHLRQWLDVEKDMENCDIAHQVAGERPQAAVRHRQCVRG